MSAPRQASLGEILDAFAAQFLDKSVVANSDQVVYVARNRPPDHLAVDRDILLRPMRRRLVTPTFDGGGRIASQITRYVTVYARLQYIADKAISDAEWINRQDQFEAAILDALLEFMPEDANGNALVTEPIRLLEGGEMTKGDDDVWGDSLATYAVIYRPKLDLNVYPPLTVT